MTDDDELPEAQELDWDKVRKSQLNQAELVWTYHHALKTIYDEGDPAVMDLTLAYQGQLMWLSAMFGG